MLQHIGLRMPTGEVLSVLVEMPAESRVDQEIAAYLGEVGERLRVYREARNLTQAALARRAQVSERQIRAIEGGADTSLSMLVRLADALSLHPEDLVAQGLLGTTAQAALDYLNQVQPVRAAPFAPLLPEPERTQCAEPGCGEPRYPGFYRCEGHLPYYEKPAGGRGGRDAAPAAAKRRKTARSGR